MGQPDQSGYLDHPGQRPQILVVDDEPEIRELLSLALADDFEILTAPTGTGALQVVQRQMPDLIILDLLLPDIDGFEVCRHLRQFSAVPILMLTSVKGVDPETTGLAAGADDYLAKPFRVAELKARLRALLRRCADDPAWRQERLEQAG